MDPSTTESQKHSIDAVDASTTDRFTSNHWCVHNSCINWNLSQYKLRSKWFIFVIVQECLHSRCQYINIGHIKYIEFLLKVLEFPCKFESIAEKIYLAKSLNYCEPKESKESAQPCTLVVGCYHVSMCWCVTTRTRTGPPSTPRQGCPSLFFISGLTKFRETEVFGLWRSQSWGSYKIEAGKWCSHLDGAKFPKLCV